MGVKKFLLLFLLGIVACAGFNQEARPTLDVTQGWENTKCPPGEVCAPEQDLEMIADDYIEALIAGNCAQAASYWLPERKDRAKEHCESGRLLPDLGDDNCQLVEFSSEETSVEQLGEGISVHISGEFFFQCDGKSETYEVNELILFFEEQVGEWFIAGFQ